MNNKQERSKHYWQDNSNLLMIIISRKIKSRKGRKISIMKQSHHSSNLRFLSSRLYLSMSLGIIQIGFYSTFLNFLYKKSN
jgi:hypothetical protein